MLPVRFISRWNSRPIRELVCETWRSRCARREAGEGILRRNLLIKLYTSLPRKSGAISDVDARMKYSKRIHFRLLPPHHSQTIFERYTNRFVLFSSSENFSNIQDKRPQILFQTLFEYWTVLASLNHMYSCRHYLFQRIFLFLPYIISIYFQFIIQFDWVYISSSYFHFWKKFYIANYTECANSPSVAN